MGSSIAAATVKLEPPLTPSVRVEPCESAILDPAANAPPCRVNAPLACTSTAGAFAKPSVKMTPFRLAVTPLPTVSAAWLGAKFDNVRLFRANWPEVKTKPSARPPPSTTAPPP